MSILGTRDRKVRIGAGLVRQKNDAGRAQVQIVSGHLRLVDRRQHRPSNGEFAWFMLTTAEEKSGRPVYPKDARSQSKCGEVLFWEFVSC